MAGSGQNKCCIRSEFCYNKHKEIAYDISPCRLLRYRFAATQGGFFHWLFYANVVIDFEFFDTNFVERFFLDSIIKFCIL